MLPLLFLLAFFFSAQAVTADKASPVAGSQAETIYDQTNNIGQPAGAAGAIPANDEAISVPPTTPVIVASPNTSAAAMEIEPYTYVDQMPEFRGGERVMLQYLGDNIKYPKAAVEAKVEGIVVLSFVVQKDGSLTDIKVIKDLGYGTAEEAARVVRQMDGQWQPGKQDGKPVLVSYTLPVHYTMKE